MISLCEDSERNRRIHLFQDILFKLVSHANKVTHHTPIKLSTKNMLQWPLTDGNYVKAAKHTMIYLLV